MENIKDHFCYLGGMAVFHSDNECASTRWTERTHRCWFNCENTVCANSRCFIALISTWCDGKEQRSEIEFNHSSSLALFRSISCWKQKSVSRSAVESYFLPVAILSLFSVLFASRRATVETSYLVDLLLCSFTSQKRKKSRWVYEYTNLFTNSLGGP